MSARRTRAPAPALRLLQLHPCDTLGGTELMVVRLAEQLERSGTPTDVATFATRGPIAAMLSARGIRVFSLGGCGGIVGASMRLARLLAQRRYDLVNAYGFKASMIARVLVRVCRLRTVVVCGVQGLHVTDLEDLASRKSRVARHLERLLSPLVDIYDVNSPGALRLLADSGISESKLRYVPHGIDVQWWERRPARSHGGIPTILCTARFVARKRQDDLVRAIAVLLERGIECHAVLAGEGPTRAACRRLAKELGVADLIDFPGSVSPAKARELMDEASVFCLPSTWEGMPTVILEAMARGVPVVGTAVNGTGDLVVDGQTGRTVPAKDPGRLAEALESVLTAPAQAARFATEARRMVEREHTVERMAELKRSLYFELLGLRPSPTSP